MSYSPAVLAVLVALPLLGAGSNAAGSNSAPSQARSPTVLQSIQPATMTHDASARAKAVARISPTPPAREQEPRCVELDKRKQLRGRLDPTVVKVAGWLLNLPLGAGRFVSLNGRRYAFCLERHYHPPGFQRGPEGWHKGVTVYDAA